MAIISGVEHQKRFITDSNGNHIPVSEWTSTNTVEVSDGIENKEKTLVNSTTWDNTYDNSSTQPTKMTDLITKITAFFNNTKYLKNIINEQNEKMHPIGSLYWSSDPTNPGTLFGFGTWERITNKFIYAAGGDIPSGHEGGSKTSAFRINAKTGDFTLQVNHLPSHRHTVPGQTVNTSDNGSHSHKYDYPIWQDTSSWDYSDYTEKDAGYGIKGRYGEYDTTTDGTHHHSVTIPEVSTSYTGGGAPHNHTINYTGSVSTMPPYIAFYCWERTA